MKLVPIALLSLLLPVTPVVGAGDAEFVAGVFDPPREAPSFSLQGSNGEELRLETYSGKVVILGFGFTSCPDVCPITLSVLAQARTELEAQSDDLAAQLQVVYVTVDPATDTPERMRKYLATFDSTFIGGTGTEKELNAVRREYGIIAQKKTYGANYTYAHSSYTYLIDRAGRIRALMPYGHTAADYAHDVKILLNE